MKPIPYLLLFCSGFAGLGYQMVWGKSFAAGLGHEYPCVLAVVSALMGGMALGSFFARRMMTNPLRSYALLELAIGAWAILSISLVPRANTFAIGLIGLDPSPFRHWLVAFLLPFLLLLPATSAMGATLPVMEQWVGGRSISLLYAVNTVGGVAGTLLTTFAIVPSLGFRRSSIALGILNILCGLLAFALQPTETVKLRRTLANPLSFRLAVTLFTSGLLGVGLEVIGVRVLTQVFENTIYTFAAILALYLSGTFAGALIYHRLRPDAVRSVDLLGGACMSCLLAIFALSLSPVTYSHFRASFASVIGVEIITAASVFLVPTMLMGALFSHLAQQSGRTNAGVAGGIALNTAGAALAPVLFPLILIPLIGARWTLILLAFGYLALVPKVTGWRFAWIGMPILTLFILPTNLHIVDLPSGNRVKAYREGIMSSVAVLEDAGGQRTLRVDNHFQMGGTASADAEYRHAHIPLLLHPDPRHALFLGLGTGISFAAAGMYPNLQADGVELIPEVVDVMNFFEPYNMAVSQNRNLKIHIADARRLIKSSSARYDVIVADLFHPARDGAGSLYAMEHFQAIRDRLKPDGLFCQWLPLHQMDRAVLGIIVKTFTTVFPNTQIYLLRYTASAPVIGLIGFMTTPNYSTNWIEKRAQDPTLQAALKKTALNDSIRFFGNLFGTDAMVQELAEGVPLNTDDRPVVTFQAPKTSARKEIPSYATLADLLGDPLPDTRELFRGNSGGLFERKLAVYMRARNTYLVGLIEEERSNLEKAIALYVESAVISPDFTTGYARCLSLAAAQAKAEPAKSRQLLQRLIEVRPNEKIAREMLDRLVSGEK